MIIFTVTAVVIICILIVSSLYVPAYAIKINGQNIGMVADLSVFEQAVDSAETKVSEILGEEYKLESSTDISMTLAVKEQLVSSNEIKDSLIEQVNEIKKSYILKVDGIIIGASEDKSSLQGMLDKIISQYTNENTTYYQFEQRCFHYLRLYCRKHSE